MKKFLTTFASLPLLAIVGTAVASEFPAKGKIVRMNSWSVTLDNGVMYEIKNTDTLRDLKPGDEVRIRYVELPEFGFVDGQIQRARRAN